MNGLTIKDKTADGRFLAFDLRDLLRLIPEDRLRRTNWRLSGVECAQSQTARRLHELSDSGERVSGTELLVLADGCSQIIDGAFVGYLGESRTPWVTIRAVDSSAYDVETDEAGLLTSIRQRYKNVKAW